MLQQTRDLFFALDLDDSNLFTSLFIRLSNFRANDSLLEHRRHLEYSIYHRHNWASASDPPAGLPGYLDQSKVAAHLLRRAKEALATMCLIKRATTLRSDGHSDERNTIFFCSNSDKIHPCDDARIETSERRPGRSSQMPLRPATSTNNEVVLHQDMAPRRHEPQPERRYSSEIGVRFRGLFRSPEFSIRRLDDGGSGSRRRRGNDEGWSPKEVMPEAPMPPPPPHLHHSRQGSPPSSLPPTIIASPNRPSPPQGPSGAAVTFTTRDTIPSSSGTPSRASSSRSKDARRAVQDITQQIVPVHVSGPSVTSNRSHRSTAGLTQLRLNPFRDSAYGGSSNISPIDAPKSDTMSEARSNTTSEHSANQRFNYSNDKAVVTTGHQETDDEDIKSNSSRSRKDYRIVRRVRKNDDPEETDRKMHEDIRVAEDYQSRTSEQGDGSVRGSVSGRRRHKKRASDE